MALNIPSELAFVLNLLGFDWPQLDEDEIHRAAQIVRQFRDDVEGAMQEASARITDDVSAALTANAAGSYTTAWNEAREDNMRQLCDILDGTATGVDLFSDAVLALKLKVIAELVITAAQLAAATAAAFVTFGASAAANVVIIAARKKALDIITEEAIAAVIVQVATMVIEPLTGAMVAALDALLESPMVTGAVGEVEEYRADLVALDQAASDIDASAQEQERLAQDFVTQLSTLQISTAG